MKTERIKLEVYSGLPVIQEMIKDSAIVKEMGENASWLSQRQHKRMSRNFQYKFTESDLQKLNVAIWNIGKRLSSVTIEYSEDRQLVIDQIKEKLSDVFLVFICESKLQKSIHWWNNRLKKTDSKGTKASFDPGDIVKINLALTEISARLLSVELVSGNL